MFIIIRSRSYLNKGSVANKLETDLTVFSGKRLGTRLPMWTEKPCAMKQTNLIIRMFKTQRSIIR